MESVIYIDMDGVLAKWNTAASIEDTYQPGYFLMREAEASIKALLQLLQYKGYNVCLLTAAYEEGTAKADKRQWTFKNNINVPICFVPYGKNKANYVDKSMKNILIDDFTKNLREWESAGNIGIKFYNGINGTHGTWNGYNINHRMSSYKMLTIVEAIANAEGVRNEL